ncbi:hypothetical protein [Flavobacterium sp.]|jgi:hypothetical protein|uniref:hypothetical protein n=1 Tax=Flavobacterium sp. TaxID=239 RepID=UPI0037BF6068
MNKKVYIYDTSKGFSSLLKHYYSSKLDFDVCTNIKRFVPDSIEGYDACFFVVNDMDDFANLMNLYFKIEHFFVGVPNLIIKDKIERLKYEEIVILEFDKSKHELLKIINHSLIQRKLIA